MEKYYLSYWCQQNVDHSVYKHGNTLHTDSYRSGIKWMVEVWLTADEHQNIANAHVRTPKEGDPKRKRSETNKAHAIILIVNYRHLYQISGGISLWVIFTKWLMEHTSIFANRLRGPGIDVKPNVVKCGYCSCFYARFLILPCFVFAKVDAFGRRSAFTFHSEVLGVTSVFCCGCGLFLVKLDASLAAYSIHTSTTITTEKQ